MRTLRATVCTLIVVATGAAALAWNPLLTNSNGVRGWDSASFPVVWNPDGGPLGMLSNGAAVTMCADQFGEWQGVATSTITYAPGAQIVDGGGTPVDVTSANYAAVIALDNGQHPIIFDNDRDIFDMLGISSTTAGFAGVLQTSGSSFVKGYAVLQGDCHDGDDGDTCGDFSEAVLRGVLSHEFGHFSGLHHTSVNHELEGGPGLPGCPPPGNEVRETMGPTVSTFSGTPHHDDEVGISFLYPTAAFASDFGRIRGRLIDRDGSSGVAGPNIVLRPALPATCDEQYEMAQAMQAGVATAEFGGEGSYEFQGLAPASDFTLLATSIADGKSYRIGGSSPPPLPGPDDYYNGAAEDHFSPPDDPAAVGIVSTTAAGTTVSGIDIRVNNPGFPGTVDVTGPAALRVDPFAGFLPAESLILDDGSSEGSSGFFGTAQTAWVNRFSPAPGQLPFRLERIDILFNSSTIAVGRPIRLLVYTDPAATGSPSGASLVYTEDTTIQLLSSTNFNEYTLATPVTITAGDFYIGAYDLVADPEDTFLARRDGDTLIERSYWQADSTDPTTYSLKADRTWMIRAYGSAEVPPGSLRLEWPISCNDGSVPLQDYAVYEGSLASLTSSPDHAPILCGTGNAPSTFLTAPGTGDRFWLVAPLLATREGGLGTGSAGQSRTPATSCATIEPATCP